MPVTAAGPSDGSPGMVVAGAMFVWTTSVFTMAIDPEPVDPTPIDTMPVVPGPVAVRRGTGSVAMMSPTPDVFDV